MEENKVIEVENEEEVTEVKKESKVKKVIGTVGSGIKKHWKTVAVGAGALVVGMVLGSRKSSDVEDSDDAEMVEFEEVTEDEVPGQEN